ncbi:MBL fold metallo-hydrolase [Paenibacillus pini]|uniref:Metal-dependent hydrolase n=1 Tax=Paenibacillus pini JCM 16418 TaxID=1236976 RepID=W7YL42_9BACL|nr:MBL fold metallo-hydrolase [Paenibacillus pini]GAF09242.1 metal-dependent hydrolase [Paenibacillus pini JCM 16418]
MNIRFLGTGAAEGVPAPFCLCEGCKIAREHQGKNVRKRSSILINDEFLIDIGPDFVSSINNQDISGEKIKIICVTHAHFDHFYPENLEIRSKRYVPNPPEQCTLIGNSSVMYKLNMLGYTNSALHLDKINIEFYRSIHLGEYLITPIEANHAKEYGAACNFLIEHYGKVLLYASDTGLYSQRTLDFLSNKNIDILIMECTNVLGETGSSHLNIEMFNEQVNRLNELNAFNRGCKFYATHFSHSELLEYKDLKKLMNDHNIEPAFDGLLIS